VVVGGSQGWGQGLMLVRGQGTPTLVLTEEGIAICPQSFDAPKEVEVAGGGAAGYDMRGFRVYGDFPLLLERYSRNNPIIILIIIQIIMIISITLVTTTTLFNNNDNNDNNNRGFQGGVCGKREHRMDGGFRLEGERSARRRGFERQG